MDAHNLKKQMMRLWKKNFHDDDEYISMVFDDYFDVDNVAYIEDNGIIVSAMLGVPYEFGRGKNRIRGLYICGISTDELHRGHGYTTELLGQINDKAARHGFAFTFLIPSSELLMNFYAHRGYHNAMYRVEDRYAENHDFRNEYMSIIDGEEERVRDAKIKQYDALVVEKLAIGNPDDITGIIDFIVNNERSNNELSCILHDRKDLLAVIEDNVIDKGDILVARKNDGVIAGILFSYSDDRKRTVIPRIYHEGNASYYKLLASIKSKHPDSSISVYCYPEETKRTALWEKTYGGANPDGGMLGGSYGVVERVYDVSRHARPYGMARIVDVREILKFLTGIQGCPKFSILVKDCPVQDFGMKCDYDGRQLTIEDMDRTQMDQLKNNRQVSCYTLRDFEEIVFRRRDNSALITEVLGLPRLGLNISLMLD